MAFRYYEKTLSEWALTNWWPEIKKLRLPIAEDDSTFGYLYKKAEDDILAYDENYNCVVVFDNAAEKPIAIAMYMVYGASHLEFMVFVHDAYRRQRLGTRLFSRIKKQTKPSKINVYPHDDTSDHFYQKTYPKHYLDED